MFDLNEIIKTIGKWGLAGTKDAASKVAFREIVEAVSHAMGDSYPAHWFQHPLAKKVEPAMAALLLLLGCEACPDKNIVKSARTVCLHCVARVSGDLTEDLSAKLLPAIKMVAALGANNSEGE